MRNGIVFLLIGLPMVFFAKGYPLLAIGCQIVVVAAYLRLAIFRRYREHVPGFTSYVILINVAGMLVGLAVHLKPDWYIGIVTLWLVACLIASYPVAKNIDKINREVGSEGR